MKRSLAKLMVFGLNPLICAARLRFDDFRFLHEWHGWLTIGFLAFIVLMLVLPDDRNLPR